MERDYLIAVDVKNIFKQVNGLKNALIEYRQTIENNIDCFVDLYKLKEGWTDLDADNVDGGLLLWHDPDIEFLYVAEFTTEKNSIGVFAVQDLKFIKNLDIPLNVYEFEGTSEDFYSGEWVSFLGDLILSTSSISK